MVKPFFLLLSATLLLRSQALLNREGENPPLLQASDWALLEVDKARNDLGCAIKWEKPILGYDLRHHSRFSVNLPYEATLAGDLTVIFRVIPEGVSPFYFRQRWSPPKVPDGIEGFEKVVFVINGGFDVGPGRYRVDWVLRDRLGNACVHVEKISIPMIKALQSMPNEVTESFNSPSNSERSERCEPEGIQAFPITVHLFVNYVPARGEEVAQTDEDRDAIVSMIRLFSRDCSVASLNLTVFDLERQIILLEKTSGQIDFRELGEALGNAKHGSIEFNSLKKSAPGPISFLHELVGSTTKNSSIVFIGPATDATGKLPENLDVSQCIRCAYLHYAPVTSPIFSDVVGRWIRRVKGAKFEIRQPPDLLQAFPQVIRVLHGETLK